MCTVYVVLVVMSGMVHLPQNPIDYPVYIDWIRIKIFYLVRIFFLTPCTKRDIMNHTCFGSFIYHLYMGGFAMDQNAAEIIFLFLHIVGLVGIASLLITMISLMVDMVQDHHHRARRR